MMQRVGDLSYSDSDSISNQAYQKKNNCDEDDFCDFELLAHCPEF